MKYINLVLISFLFISCEENQIKESIELEIQSIIDANNVKGSVLIYDFNKNEYYSNDFNWAKKGRLPASTFKIANSIIALETNVVESDSTLFKWNGEKRAYKNWEQDLLLREAFHFSCVPCYQEIAKIIGAERMNNYLDKLEYPGMNLSAKNIDVFWLEGTSKINQFEQIDFLKRLYTSKLNISKRTEAIMKRMMVIEENENYTLKGKTGLSIRSETINGWFVGYIEFKKATYFFATNIEPTKRTEKRLFPKIRKEITIKALKLLE